MNGKNKPGCIPHIDVVSWDANNLYVKCPYCEEIHHHRRNSYERVFRASRCGSLGWYEYTFPFDEATQRVAYEIDKSRYRFINICTLQDLDEESDEDEQLASDFSSKVKVSDRESFRRGADRKEILRLLGDSTDKRKTVLGALAKEFEDCSFSRLPTGQSVIFRESIAHTNITSRCKAVARLERGGLFPPITSMSGWSPNIPAPYLNGEVWTKEVFRLSDEVGHKLTPEPLLDQDVPGRSHACHAEKQLIAYFISRHVVLPSEQVPNEKLRASIEHEKHEISKTRLSSPIVKELRGIERAKGKLGLKLKNLLEKEEAHHKMIELWRNKPPVSLKEAVILITAYSGTICDDCQAFVDKVNSVLGLSIKLIECTDKRKATLKQIGGSPNCMKLTLSDP